MDLLAVFVNVIKGIERLYINIVTQRDKEIVIYVTYIRKSGQMHCSI